MNQTPEANVRLVRTSLDAFNANDIDACVARLAPDFVMHLAELPDPIRGPESWREGAAVIKRAFPDLQVRIDEIVAAGDRIAARLTLQGTHSEDYLAFPATGRRVSYVSHEFYRVSDGLIAEEWVCSDNATLFRQLGAG